MRSIFIYCIAIFSALPLFALSGQSRLSISAVDQSLLRIVIDERYERQGQYITIEDLPAGRHYVQIYQTGADRRNSGNFRLVYSSQVLLRPQVHTDIVVNRFGKVLIDERQAGVYNDNDRDRRRDRNDRDRDYRGRNDRADRFNQPMDDNTFYTVKQAIRRERVEREKIDMATRILQSNCVTAFQVRDLIQLFSFEGSKLDFAKYAYAKTVDRQNYPVLLDCFTYAKSRQELEYYIRNK